VNIFLFYWTPALFINEKHGLLTYTYQKNQWLILYPERETVRRLKEHQKRYPIPFTFTLVFRGFSRPSFIKYPKGVQGMDLRGNFMPESASRAWPKGSAHCFCLGLDQGKFGPDQIFILGFSLGQVLGRKGFEQVPFYFGHFQSLVIIHRFF